MPRTGSRPDPRCPGYALPELLIALGLLGLVLAGSAAGLLEGRNRWRVRAAAQEVALTLVAARSRAVLDHSPVSVVFEPAARRYLMVPTRTGTAAPLVRPPAGLPRGTWFHCPDGTPAVGCSPPGTSDPAARFDARGRLLSRTSPARICVSDAARQSARRITLEPSGRIWIERWTGSGWVR